ncbi:MAG: hypothetical protein M3R70_07055 [Actinomycetota bacterium]|nr:hypothetical protein [Actinomycetota bacterium]
MKHVERYSGGLSNGVRAEIGMRGAGVKTNAHGSVAPTSRNSEGEGQSNVQANTDSSPALPQNETAVAHNIDHPANAVAASNDYIDGGLWIGTTHDGGSTWASQFLTPQFPSTRDYCTGGDPTVVYSKRNHTFYAAQLCFFRAHPESAIEVIQSTDGGDHWTGSRSSTAVITNRLPDGSIDPSVFYDKELMAVDNHPSSPHYGRLYVSYTKFHLLPDGSSDYCPVQVGFTDKVDSNDDGILSDTAWTNVAVTPDTPGAAGLGESANQFSTPAIDDKGGVNIAYAIEDCNTASDRGLRFKRSTTGGASWPASPTVIDKPGQFADNPDPADHLPNKNARIPISPSLAFNGSSKQLGYVYQNNVNSASSGADITFQSSADYGASWSNIQYVSVKGNGTTPASNDQFFPWIQPNPRSSGWRVILYDNRNDPGNTLIETFMAKSKPGGWKNRDISSVAWNPNLAFFSSGSFIGDYNGLAVAPGYEYPVWADGRNSPGPPKGQTDIFTVPNKDNSNNDN